MDIKQLEVFLAIYEECSISKAAERLNATQPGTSVRIANLEEELGVTLFQRNARGVTQTAAADLLFQHATQIIHLLNNAVKEIRTLSRELSGNICIGIPPTLSSAITAPVLMKFTQQYPRVNIRIIEEYSASLLDLLENRTIDAAFTIYIPDRPSVKFTPVYQDRFVVISGPQHQFPRSELIALNAPPYFNIITPSLCHGLHSLLDEPLKTGQIVAKRSMQVDGLAGLFEFVRQSNWIALLPFAAAASAAVSHGLKFNRVKSPEIGIQYYISTTRTHALSEAAAAFIDEAKLSLENLTAQWSSSAPTIDPDHARLPDHSFA